MKYRIDFTGIPWEEPIKGLRFKATVQDGTRIRLAEFSKDFIEAEWCLKGHTGYLLEGSVEIDFNGEKIIFNQGDGIYIPPGEQSKHKTKVLSDKAVAILIEKI